MIQLNDDPFELLKRTRPLPDGELVPGEYPGADALLARITAGRHFAEPTPNRRRWLVGGAVALVAVGAGSVAAVLNSSRPADPATLMCYSEASTSPAGRAVGHIDPDSTPVRQCELRWSDGTFGVDDSPSLVACSAGGVTVVVPGGASTCTELGFAALAAPTGPDLVDARVASEVPGLFAECVPDLDEAAASVSAMFDELGATDWTVRVEGATSSERPCAANVIDAVTREVLIVAV